MDYKRTINTKEAIHILVFIPIIVGIKTSLAILGLTFLYLLPILFGEAGMLAL